MTQPSTGISWVYQQVEPGVFTVGFYNPTGEWIPEKDTFDRDEAAARVAWLNGSATFPSAS